MKIVNAIILLLSFISSISAMEEISVKKDKTVLEKCNKRFVKLNAENAKLIEYYTGCNIRYYKEYRAQQNGTDILFPVECTDPLPIEYYGEKRFFVSSATVGSKGSSGTAYTISDSAVRQMAVVRGVVQSNNVGVNIYLGLETDKVELTGYKGFNKIYPARAMLIQAKEKSGSDNGFCWYNNIAPIKGELGQLSNMELGSEAAKHVSPQDRNWKSPVFQEKIKELLGVRAKDFKPEMGGLIFSRNYWTKTENKLKCITYNSANQ